MMAVDIVGPLPKTKSENTHILVFTEYLTKWVEAFPISTTDTPTIAKIFVEEIICRHGAPKRLLSDRGTNFMSQFLSNVCNILGTERNFTTAYHPQTDGLTERFNKTLADMISMYVSTDNRDWDECLPYILFAYRTSMQESTLEKPFYLLYGREPRLPIDVSFQPQDTNPPDPEDFRTKLISRIEKTRKIARENILRAQEKQRKQYVRKGKSRFFEVGSQVWIFTPIVKKGTARKFAHQWFGPYRIIKKTFRSQLQSESELRKND
jgi:hypothetical protein